MARRRISPPKATATPAPKSTPETPNRIGAEMEAYFLPNLVDRRRTFDFLELSFKGGIGYKWGLDARGQAILIEHENEKGGKAGATSAFVQAAESLAAASGIVSTSTDNRYERRRRQAAYENHVKPIVQKVVAYLTRNRPIRPEDEKVSEELTRLSFDEWIRDLVEDGLKFNEAWIGFDTVATPEDPVTGQPTTLTEADIALLDPDHKGRPYVVMADPRRVVDYEIVDGDVARVVIEEIVKEKASLSSPVTERVYYKEWTATEWTLYELVEKDDKSRSGRKREPGAGHKVKVVKQGQHQFGQCPWYCFRPMFPIEDLCELNRALFNITSLLDEELYQSTFTQKYVVGARAEDLNKTQFGAGNTLIVEQQGAQVGVFGAVEGQARSLMDRVDQIRDSLYILVSMENTSTKNVAEAAEKKKRDLESLYTMLVHIIDKVEKIENGLLAAMQVYNPDSDQKTQYDRTFDVASLNELVEHIRETFKLPFVPARFKRRQILALVQKMQPFASSDEYTADVDLIPDVSETVVNAVRDLSQAGLFTPEQLARILGIPEAEVAAFIARLKGHEASQQMDPGSLSTEEDDAELDEDEDDAEDSGSPEPEPGVGRGRQGAIGGARGGDEAGGARRASPVRGVGARRVAPPRSR